jgi:hypothetical protein
VLNITLMVISSKLDQKEVRHFNAKHLRRVDNV